MYQRAGRLDSNSASARSVSASSSPSSETRMWRSVAEHVDPVVGVARVHADLLALLQPPVHAVEVEGDQVLRSAARPASGPGSTRRPPRPPRRRPGSCSTRRRPSWGSGCGGRWARGTRRGRPRAGSSRSAAAPDSCSIIARRLSAITSPPTSTRIRLGVGSRYSACPGGGRLEVERARPASRPSGPVPVMRPIASQPTNATRRPSGRGRLPRR